MELAGILGLYGGLTIGLLGWFFGREAARKKKGLDEMHSYIWNKARSTSWYVTAAAIYVLMTLAMFGIKLNIIPALSILLLVHLASWSIAGFVYSFNLAGLAMPKRIITLSTLIGAFFLLFFMILSVITDNWKFLFAALPPIVMNTLITIIATRRIKDAKAN